MDAPKCRLCGKRHWGICAAIKSDPAIVVNSVVNIPENMVNGMVNEPDMVNNSEGKPSYKYRDAEKRRVYLRDKMREIRAKKKRGE